LHVIIKYEIIFDRRVIVNTPRKAVTPQVLTLTGYYYI